jgi:hypothetical protein
MARCQFRVFPVRDNPCRRTIHLKRAEIQAVVTAFDRQAGLVEAFFVQIFWVPVNGP